MRRPPFSTPRSALGAAVMACALGSGCGDSRSVSVGEVSAEISLASCHGEGTECGPSPVEPSPAPTEGSELCDPGADGVARILWQTDLDSRSVPCELGACRASDFRAALAPDGSVWVTAMVTTLAQDNNAAGVFLGHYGAAGEVVSEAVIAFDVVERDRSVWFAPFVAVDSRGHAFVSAYENVHSDQIAIEQHVWIAEYDATGAAVGDRVPVVEREGIARLVVLGEDEWVLNVSPWGDDVIEPAVLAGLTPGGELRFAQIAMRETHVTSIVSDPAGRITAAGHIRGVVRSGDSYGLSQYDPQGNLVWARDLPPQCASIVVGDRSGNLVRIGCPPQQVGPLDSQLQVEKLNVMGDRIWALHVDLPNEPFGFEASAAVDDENAVYVPTVRLTATASYQPTIHRLQADGQSCKVYVLDDPAFLGPAPANHFRGGILVPAPDEVYVVTAAGIARLQLQL